ncbi:MAG: (Fe-S)-binding protein [Candidatus Promineifilaceae bacterium]|nr:(Fe-S)-binding protein [Candidatus Promineifilaceae bacterium]
MIDLVKRESPKDKPVSLFVTCLVDVLFPETGKSMVQVLEYLGVEVNFPAGQTCCGQPGFNAGYWNESRRVAAHFLEAFENAEVIVTPSGSCAAMVRHEYSRLFSDDPRRLAEAKRLAGITWEFTEYLVDGLGITDLQGRLPNSQTFAFHDACHSLRLMGLGNAARTLIGGLDNAQIIELPEHDVCCGFGGLFSVKMADISGAMLKRKVANIHACPAQVLSSDTSCLAHINGGLQQLSEPKKVRHVADILAEGIAGKADYHTANSSIGGEG